MHKLNKQFFILLFLAFAAYGQQERVAVIQTLDDRDSIGISDLNYLTDRLRKMATDALPEQRYGVMTTESIVSSLGSQEAAMKVLKEATSLPELGRKVGAGYVVQAHIGRFDKYLSIKAELYNAKSGVMVGSFTGTSDNINGLLSIIDGASYLFKKLPGISMVSPIVAGERLYLVNLSAEPPDAVLSFDGVQVASCNKMPCKVLLNEGNVRITANLEQHKMADTTVSINQNNQSITIRLKSNLSSSQPVGEVPATIIPSVIKNEIEDKMPIYSGTNPPDITGQYKVTNIDLVSSNIKNDKIGERYADMYIAFVKGANGKLSYKERQSDSESEGDNVIVEVVGSSNNFTAYFESVGVSKGINKRTSTVISGTWTSTGISNFYYAFLMLEKSPDPNNALVPVNTWRVFKDSDGFVDKYNWLSTSE
ncbi:MAG: hypothetical protein FWF67_00075 [Fibromonadales bacterium]|nr:hypothetical protein [Fibromonadales bacterium]